MIIGDVLGIVGDAMLINMRVYNKFFDDKYQMFINSTNCVAEIKQLNKEYNLDDEYRRKLKVIFSNFLNKQLDDLKK